MDDNLKYIINVIHTVDQLWKSPDPADRLDAMAYALSGVHTMLRATMPPKAFNDILPIRTALLHLEDMLTDGLAGDISDPCWPQNLGPRDGGRPTARRQKEAMYLLWLLRRRDLKFRHDKTAYIDDVEKGLNERGLKLDDLLEPSTADPPTPITRRVQGWRKKQFKDQERTFPEEWALDPSPDARGHLVKRTIDKFVESARRRSDK